MLPLNLAVNAALAALLLVARHLPRPLLVLPAMLVVGPAVAVAFRTTTSSFFPLTSGLAWVLFLWGPLLLLLDARRGGSRALRVVPALALLAVGAWAFGVEPRRLDVHAEAIAAPGLDAPLRVALVADIQTDRVDAHTEAAFAALRDARPDLVLYAGDYLQIPDGPVFEAEAARLRALVSSVEAPLGSLAVRGDVDPDRWAAIFAGTGVTASETTRTVAVGGLTVTALSPRDSRSSAPPVPEADGFHLVFGHAPDYVLARPAGDLFLAGHTHGGQVQLPLLGPLITYSAVPRAMAAGLSRLPDGRPLYVSRGIGLERRDAPRLRFLCPPELVMLDLAPAVSAPVNTSNVRVRPS